MIKINLKRFTAVLVLILAVSIVFAIVPDPKKKKKVTTTTTTTTTQKKVAVTTQKKQTSSSIQKKSSSSENTCTITENSSGMTIRFGNVSFNMVRVEGGTFMMGATSEQCSDADNDEKPTHSVTLFSYYIGEMEVTQELWEEVIGNNPSHFKGAGRPVENVSWEDSQVFIRKLNQRTGKNFRLPTEAEWEYAARGGRKSCGYQYAGGSSIDDVAWYTENSSDETHNVGLKRANELGLYDMSGNVYEWCQDWNGAYPSSSQTNPSGPSTGFSHVVRGGCWVIRARHCRVSSRGCGASLDRGDYLGLRLAL